MTEQKFIIHASNHEELMFGAECGFDMVKNEYKVCGYANNRFFAACRKSKKSITIRVSENLSHPFKTSDIG